MHYVEGLKYNILSISQMCDIGDEVKFMEDKCFVTNCVTGKLVISSKRVRSMYVADLESIEGDNLSCLSAQIDESDL